MRLKAGIWVGATLRRWAGQGLMAVVARKGDEDAGAVMVKHRLAPHRFMVFTQVREGEAQVWLCRTGPDPVDETQADLIIARAVDVDGDLWVIEVEGLPNDASPILLEKVLAEGFSRPNP